MLHSGDLNRIKLDMVVRCTQNSNCAIAKQIAVRISIAKIASWLLIATWLITGLTMPLQAQISNGGENLALEQEYRDELDKWMLRAYEGDRDAQFKVGVLFTNDQFDKPDFEQAVYWYKQASRQGHVLAQYNLGHQYLTGVGVVQNEVTAMKWWLEAAKQGHALAQFNVGRAYYLGIGLDEDHQKSRHWFERAARNQEPKSIEILQQLGWADGVDLAVINSEPQAELDNLVTQTPQAEPEPADRRPPPEQAEKQVEKEDPKPKAPPLTSRITPAVIETEPIVSDNPKQPKQTLNAPTHGWVVSKDIKAKPLKPVNKEALTPPPKPPLALYTDPSVRSVLIAILDSGNKLTVVEKDNEWYTITSAAGFPVWVHKDFLRVSGDTGMVTGNAVNARSVPIITNGTVVGRLDKGEKVEVLDQRKSWYRVISPAHFRAWVKTEDYDRYSQTENETELVPVSSTAVTEDSLPAEGSLLAEGSPVAEGSPEAEGSPVAEGATPVGDSSPAIGSLSPEESTTPSPVRDVTPTVNTQAINDSSGSINDNNWLFSQQADNYTLQLASFDDPFKVDEFLSRSKFVDNPELHRFTATSKGITWTYFLYGSYSDRKAANQAQKDIKQKLAWVRTFGRLQQNRCLSWKTKLPTPPELNQYCLNKQ